MIFQQTCFHFRAADWTNLGKLVDSDILVNFIIDNPEDGIMSFIEIYSTLKIV
jgi:hypothetical protein